MKKKMMSGFMAMAAVVALAVPVFAEDDGLKTGTVTLGTDKDSVYNLIIPKSTQEIKYRSVDTPIGYLKVTGNVDVGESVSVSTELKDFVHIKSDQEKFSFELMNTLEPDMPVQFVKTVWDETELLAGEKQIPLTIHIPEETWESARAGVYEGEIIFKANLEK